MISNFAIIDYPCSIAPNVNIWHFSHVLAGSTIGDGCNIGQNVSIGPDVTIGSRCKIQNNVSIYKGITIEDDVFIGPSAVFTNIINPRAFISRMDEVKPTRICKGATIGANSTILCGVTIGAYSMVGAGAVVTKDVPAHTIVVGNPARIIGYACRCGGKISDHSTCTLCGINYEVE